MPPVVLVVGGAGAFGSRLVDGLIRTSDFEVVIAGRDLTRTEARATALGSRARAKRLDTETVRCRVMPAAGARSRKARECIRMAKIYRAAPRAAATEKARATPSHRWELRVR